MLFYPRKRGWPHLPHSASNLSHSHYPSRSILCILLQTNILTLLLHLWSPCLPRSSSLPLSLHFKLKSVARFCCRVDTRIINKLAKSEDAHVITIIIIIIIINHNNIMILYSGLDLLFKVYISLVRFLYQ